MATFDGAIDRGEVFPEAFGSLRSPVPELRSGDTPNPRYDDETFRLGFARLVTHFFGQHAFLPPDGISGHTDTIAHIPGVLVQGRTDIAAPLGTIWRLTQ